MSTFSLHYPIFIVPKLKLTVFPIFEQQLVVFPLLDTLGEHFRPFRPILDLGHVISRFVCTQSTERFRPFVYALLFD